MNTQTSRSDIMVVDDEPTITALMKHILEARLKVRVRERNSSIRAFVDLNQDDLSVDLLVTDFMMPEIGGLELAMEARRHRKNLPILVVTGHPQDAEDAIRQAHLGSISILAKPFVQSALLAKIDDAIAGSRLS